MLIISHRGNITTISDKTENSPDQIIKVIDEGFDCEIDLRVVDNKLYLGHDVPSYEIPRDFLQKHGNNLWIHCKNIEALLFCQSDPTLNYFFHQNDLFTVTSKGFIWVHPDYFTKEYVNNTENIYQLLNQTTNKKIIFMLPSIYDFNLMRFFIPLIRNESIMDIGVCTDFPTKFVDTAI